MNIGVFINLLESIHEFSRALSNTEKGKVDQYTPVLPIISSSCPGFVCYAEKKLGKAMLDHVSKIKPPQEIFSMYLQHLYPDAKIFHVSIAPCFDKKLEAARSEFDGYTDAVLTPKEIVQLLELRKKDLLSDYDPREAEISQSWESGISTNFSKMISFYDMDGNSGGYAYYALAQYVYESNKSISIADLEALMKDPKNLDIKFPKRNKDWNEVMLASDQMDLVPQSPFEKFDAKFVRAYGFRNIQNASRLLKQKKKFPLYIEVMACPQGCLNGGGQLLSASGEEFKGSSNKQKSLKEMIGSGSDARVRDLVFVTSGSLSSQGFEFFAKLYQGWVKASPGSVRAVKLFTTSYSGIFLLILLDLTQKKLEVEKQGADNPQNKFASW